MGNRALMALYYFLTLTALMSAGVPLEQLPWRPAVKVFNDRSGLPQNSVENFALDAEGFLWVGTQNGAARYDGHHWLVVDMPTPQRSNWVSALLPTPEGMLVGTIGDGLHRWQAGKWTTLRPPAGQSFQRVQFLGKAAGGGVWVGTQDDGLWLLK
jgi:ligand-binding sensor domain-containing protein